MQRPPAEPQARADDAEEERAAVEVERQDFNIRRMRQLSGPFCLLLAAATPAFARFVHPATDAERVWHRNLIALNLGLLLVLLLVTAGLRRAPRHVAARLSDLAGVSLLLWGALASANVQRVHPAIDIFLLATGGVAFGLRLSLALAAAAQLSACAVLVAGVVGLQPDRSQFRPEVLLILTTSATALWVARSNLTFLASDVRNRRLIERQRRELAELNQSLERRVAVQVDEIVRRSEQVERLNAELREKVQERSRELSLLLTRLGGERGDGTLARGSTLASRFLIDSVLGRGGMGVVYAATDAVTRERVALKVVTAATATELDGLYRFLREADASARVAHPAIVHARHVDVADGQLFQVFDLVEGEALDRYLLRVGRVPAWRAADIGARVADALAAAHAGAVIHRDIKPGNVMLTGDATGVRLLDFGISKLRSAVHRQEETRRGLVLGTPAYMAPEQSHDAASASDRSDVYSLGVVLFELLSGELPFTGADYLAVLEAHRTRECPDVRSLAPAVAPELAELLRRCLAREPALRPNAAELARELRAFAEAHRRDPAPDADERRTPPRSPATLPEAYEEG